MAAGPPHGALREAATPKEPPALRLCAPSSSIHAKEALGGRPRPPSQERPASSGGPSGCGQRTGAHGREPLGGPSAPLPDTAASVRRGQMQK